MTSSEIKFHREGEPLLPLGQRPMHEWEKKRLVPLSRHPRTGKLKPSIRTGKHACQRGAIDIDNRRLVGVEL